MDEITTVEGLTPYLGKVVKVLFVPEWGWLFHILAKGLDFRDPKGLVRSTVQVHNGVHQYLGLTEARFRNGMKVLPCESPAEYAGIEFSYGEQPPK